ncbi:MAG: Mrp/NBP35 family ATP-binding protein [Desulfobacterales bacterium]|nr:Mrp/NBP35 family ATP-binding protein [Desulfobacterales bacterium]MDJ0876428.1 Mrp/NBP35 family ATP-binding protein [Desulfobacterales bacterium]MDJ0883566.1 Mrp/NBP35 family ATP-binding protein [Desulfobacterales bacterium]
MTQIMGSPEEAQKGQTPGDDKDAEVQASLNRIKQKVVIMSGKGGVGKTSTSVNLAIALARLGYNVGLLDVDLHGPDVPRVLGLSAMLGLSANQKLDPLHFNDHLKVVSIESLMASKDDAVIWRGPMKYSAIRQFISDVDWGDLDFLLIDSPPGTGDEPLTVAQTIPDAKAVIVTTPQEVSLADVRKSINFCHTVKMEIFGLVENMSGYVCPHCDEKVDIFGAGGGEKTAREARIDFLGSIPLDPNVVTCGDTGKSYQETYPESAVTRAYEEIAGKIGKLL